MAVRMHECRFMPESDGEWTFLTSDPDTSCAVCGSPIRAGQAAGYIHGETVHARCYRPPEEWTDPEA